MKTRMRRMMLMILKVVRKGERAAAGGVCKTSYRSTSSTETLRDSLSSLGKNKKIKIKE
jgi:hypothetical protein